MLLREAPKKVSHRIDAPADADAQRRDIKHAPVVVEGSSDECEKQQVDRDGVIAARKPSSLLADQAERRREQDRGCPERQVFDDAVPMHGREDETQAAELNPALRVREIVRTDLPVNGDSRASRRCKRRRRCQRAR